MDGLKRCFILHCCIKAAKHEEQFEFLFYCQTLLLKLFSVRYLIQNLLTCTFCCNWVLPVITVVLVVTLLKYFKEEKGKKTFVLFEGAF